MIKLQKLDPREALVAALQSDDLSERAPERVHDMLLRLVDYCIVEGAQIRAPHFVHYMQMARIELEHWRRPCETCGRPRTIRDDPD